MVRLSGTVTWSSPRSWASCLRPVPRVLRALPLTVVSAV